MSLAGIPPFDIGTPRISFAHHIDEILSRPGACSLNRRDVGWPRTNHPMCWSKKPAFLSRWIGTCAKASTLAELRSLAFLPPSKWSVPRTICYLPEISGVASKTETNVDNPKWTFSPRWMRITRRPWRRKACRSPRALARFICPRE
jgi:hypothetical protein